MIHEHRKRIAFFISGIDKALAFEWIADNLDAASFDLVFILLNAGESHLERYLRSRGFHVIRVPYRGKRDIPSALWASTCLLRRLRPESVHTHLLDASLVGLIAARIVGVPRRIHTRHHGDLHHRYFPRAVKIDRLINALSTDIVAPSLAVQRMLAEEEGVPVSKIAVIPHGFDLSSFQNVSETRKRDLLDRHQIAPRHPIIGVVSRFTDWKGVQFIIPAFRAILREAPTAQLVLANCTGDMAGPLTAMLVDLPKGSVTMIPFEPDNQALFQTFDVFVHVPIGVASEAFGQVYVEALAAGVPSVFTMSGVAPEFIRHEQNALVVNECDPNAIKSSVMRLLSDTPLRRRLIDAGREAVQSRFPLQAMVSRLEDLYSR